MGGGQQEEEEEEEGWQGGSHGQEGLGDEVCAEASLNVAHPPTHLRLRGSESFCRVMTAHRQLCCGSWSLRADALGPQGGAWGGPGRGLGGA